MFLLFSFKFKGMRYLTFVVALGLLSCSSAGGGGTVSSDEKGKFRSYPSVIDSMVSAMSRGDFDAFVRTLDGRKLLFSVDAYIDDIDPVVDSALSVSDRVILWGYEPGSGRPIRLTFREFFDRYLSHPYAEKGRVSIDSTLCTGNTPFNFRDVFDRGVHFVEFCIPGTEKYGHLDWHAVRFIFVGDSLLAVVHDSWSP